MEGGVTRPRREGWRRDGVGRGGRRDPAGGSGHRGPGREPDLGSDSVRVLRGGCGDSGACDSEAAPNRRAGVGVGHGRGHGGLLFSVSRFY